MVVLFMALSSGCPSASISDQDAAGATGQGVIVRLSATMVDGSGKRETRLGVPGLLGFEREECLLPAPPTTMNAARRKAMPEDKPAGEEGSEATKARDQFWTSLQTLQPELVRIAQGEFDGTDRQKQLLRIIAQVTVFELKFRAEWADPG